MQKLVWQNANGDEINLTGGNYGITEWEGFSNASLNIQNQQVPFQDGAVFLDALIEPRELSVTLKMQDNGNLEARYEMRRELIHALNPKLGEGYLIYTNDFISKRIKCIPQIPLFETHNSDTRGTPKASLAWTACEPYWEDLEETIVDLGYENTINNEGDVEVGIEVEIASTKESFEITNITQNKKISVRQGGYGKFKLNTNFGQKKLEKIFYNYLVKGAYVNSVIYDNDKLIYGCEGGFVCSTSDFKKIEIKNIKVNSPRTNNELRNFCKKDGYVYCIEDYVGVMRSEDFENWEVVHQNDIEFQYLKKLQNGRLITYEYSHSEYSDNGIDWVSFTGTATSILDIIFVPSKNKYYIIDSNYNIASSSNLINWNIEYQGQGGSYNFRYILYNSRSNKFILTTNNYQNYKILITEDFSTFNETYTSDVFYLNEYDNYLFLVDNEQLKISTDNGLTFNETNITTIEDNIMYVFRIGSVYYITLRNLSILASNDLFEWYYVLNTNIISYRMSASNKEIQKLSNGELFWTGSFSSNPKRCFILKNNNEVVMSEEMQRDLNPYLSIEYYNNEYYLLCERNKIKKSTDGKQYTLLSTIENDSTYPVYLYKINDKFIVATTTNVVFISEDCINWQRQSVLYAIRSRPIYFNEKWYAILKYETDYYIGVSNNGYDFVIEQEMEEKPQYTSTSPTMQVCNNFLIVGYSYVDSSSNVQGVVIYEKEINREWVKKYLNTIIYGVNTIIKKENKYICFGYFNQGETEHLIEFYSENNIINYNSIIKNQMQALTYTNDKKIFMVGYAYFGFLDENGIPQNCIDLLSKDSDMTLGLNIGNNAIINNSNGNLFLKFRQKYIGV